MLLNDPIGGRPVAASDEARPRGWGGAWVAGLRPGHGVRVRPGEPAARPERDKGETIR